MRGLVKNQQLWSLLLRDVGSSSNGLPQALKSDLMSLGFLVMRETIAAMGDSGRPIASLIQVNDDMLGGLRAVSPLPVAEARPPAVLARASRS